MTTEPTQASVNLAKLLEETLEQHNGMLPEIWVKRFLDTLRPIQARKDGLISDTELGRVLRKRWGG